MRRIWLSILFLIGMAGSAAAQRDYGRIQASLVLGGASPHEDLSPFFRTDFIAGGTFGYRLHRNFQVEAGYEKVFGAADVKDYLDTDFGPVRIRDRQYFVPFGGRAILPLAGGRVNLYGGAGGAYMRYSEILKQPSDYYRIECPYCYSRDGWGYYALVGMNTAVDRGRHLFIGFQVRSYRGHTEGEPLGTLPPIRTRDTWINYMTEISVAF